MAVYFKIGDLIGLASGITLAVGYVAMRFITQTDGFKTILFYFSLTALILSLPLGIIYWSDPGYVVEEDVLNEWDIIGHYRIK